MSGTIPIREHVMPPVLGLWHGIWGAMLIETTFTCYEHGKWGTMSSIGVTLKPETLKVESFSRHICIRLEQDLWKWWSLVKVNHVPNVNLLKSNFITPPQYYNTGKRLGQIYHARLRTACSPLRQHLHSKNIVDNPYCTCGDIEDTHHFLFVCQQYTDLRQDLLNSVSDICQPNLNVLLCGDITLTFVQNKQIFKAVQEFIIKSKRFEYTH